MKPNLKHVAVAGIIAATFTTQASALLIPITENIRPVEKREEISPGVFANVVTITVVEGTPEAPIVKTMKEYSIPATEGEGTVKYLLETTITVVPDGNGQVIVTTTTNTTTTPVGTDGEPTGGSTTVPGSPSSSPPTDLEDVDLPEETVVGNENEGPLGTSDPISGQ